MSELTCIVCPLGCRLTVEAAAGDGRADGELAVSGNRCPRGAVYAVEETRAPKRVVTATCRLAPAGGAAGRARRRGLGDPRRLPVRTAAAVPKEWINDLLADIYRLEAVPPVTTGQVLIGDWRGRGIAVLAARGWE